MYGEQKYFTPSYRVINNQNKRRFLRIIKILFGKPMTVLLTITILFFALVAILYVPLEFWLSNYVNTHNNEYPPIALLFVFIIITLIVASISAIYILKLIVKKVPAGFSSIVSEKIHIRNILFLVLSTMFYNSVINWLKNIYAQNNNLSIIIFLISFIIMSMLLASTVIVYTYCLFFNKILSKIRNQQNQLNQSEFWNTAIPITAFAMGIISIILLFGLDSIVLSYDDFFSNFIQNMLIGAIIPFDIGIAICTLVAFLLRRRCKRKGYKRESLAKKGMIISIICLIISLTPFATTLQIMSYTVFNLQDMREHLSGVYTAKDNDYTISDLQVVFNEGSMWPYLVASGVITNTTEYDWEFVHVNIQFVEGEGRKYPFESHNIWKCVLNDVPRGGNAYFETPNHAINYPEESDKQASCKIVSIQYKIKSQSKQ